MNLTDSLTIDELLLKRKSLRRRLSAAPDLRPLRIAVLGGSTTSEVVDLWELFLMEAGFAPVFHQTEYGRFYEDAVLDPTALTAFKPDIVYVHTSLLNVQEPPPIQAAEPDFQGFVDAEYARYESIWNAIEAHTGAQIIQNNFEAPPNALLGNLDAVSSGGRTRFLHALNTRFAEAAAVRPRLLLQDVQTLSAQMGLRSWFDWDRFYSYKILTSAEASVTLARSLASLVRALYGKSRKALVLDLDNTCWGGVIGDDGVDHICIGRETPLAEAYTAFQQYCLALQRRGVLLAVCSKNDDAVARSGFAHPDSVLKLEDISCFKANWSPKHENILAIAQELNLGVDSFVFVDDNPAERAIVSAQLPEVAVPDVGSDVSRYAAILDQGRYFEAVSVSEEDLQRAGLYQSNAARSSAASQFADYGEYLDSLEMTAEIDGFKPVYIERIAQLTNKTNQFNLTTRRYTLAEMESAMHDERVTGLYGRLSDRFGDNGIVSVVLGRREGETLHMDLWLMSCRVLKRDMEKAMLDALVERAAAAGILIIEGAYLASKKNAMVADHYEKLGFEPVTVDASSQASVWRLEVATYKNQNQHIRTLELVHE